MGRYFTVSSLRYHQSEGKVLIQQGKQIKYISLEGKPLSFKYQCNSHCFLSVFSSEVYVSSIPSRLSNARTYFENWKHKIIITTFFIEKNKYIYINVGTFFIRFSHGLSFSWFHSFQIWWLPYRKNYNHFCPLHLYNDCCCNTFQRRPEVICPQWQSLRCEKR